MMSVTVSSAEFGVMKPDPRIFQEALDRMDVAASRAVMVGDSLAHDVIGARSGRYASELCWTVALARVPTIRK